MGKNEYVCTKEFRVRREYEYNEQVWFMDSKLI